MKLRWLIPFAVLLPLRLGATGPAVSARVATITINPNQVTALHLRPEFESTIRMPEEITSVILGSPSSFKAEHNEGEPQYDDVCGHRRAEFAVALVDVLDGLFAFVPGG